MNVREIVEAHLNQVGAHGLCTDECGCWLDDLVPCGEINENCVPAVSANCVDECEMCDGGGCLVPMPEEEPTSPEVGCSAFIKSKGPGRYSACGGCSPEGTSDYADCDACSHNPHKPNPAICVKPERSRSHE